MLIFDGSVVIVPSWVAPWTGPLLCAEALWNKPRTPSKTIKVKNRGRGCEMGCITALNFKPRAPCAQLEAIGKPFSAAAMLTTSSLRRTSIAQVDCRTDSQNLIWRTEVEIVYPPSDFRFMYAGLADPLWRRKRERLRATMRDALRK